MDLSTRIAPLYREKKDGNPQYDFQIIGTR